MSTRDIVSTHSRVKIKRNSAPTLTTTSISGGYLEALVQENVEPVLSNVMRVTPTGIVTEDGTEHKMDVLVCATGFKVAFRPAFKV